MSKEEHVVTLDTLSQGQSGIVSRVTGEGALRRRLFDMGITPGAKITLRKVAPLGDPIEVNLRGYELSLRKEEAKVIYLTVE